MNMLATYFKLNCTNIECKKLIGYIKAKENTHIKPKSIQLCLKCGGELIE